MQGTGLKGQDKVSFWKKSLIRLLKHVFFCLQLRTDKGRTGWKETVELKLTLILLKCSLQVLIPKDYTESQDLVILSKMSKWRLTEVQSFLQAGTLCWCSKYTQLFYTACFMLLCLSVLKGSGSCTGRRGAHPRPPTPPPKKSVSASLWTVLPKSTFLLPSVFVLQ